MQVGEELGDDGALGDDGFFLAGRCVFDGGHEAAGVDVEVPCRTGNGEVDDYLLVGEFELVESDVGAMGEGAAVIGIEGYFWSSSIGRPVCCSHVSWEGREFRAACNN